MTPAILAFLAQFGCVPTANVIVDDTLPVLRDTPGFYRDGTVYLRSTAGEEVLVHELVHDCQFQKHGRAVNSKDFFHREWQAKHIERAWKEQNQ